MNQHEADTSGSTSVEAVLGAGGRRTFLKRAGIAGAAAWTAPMLLSSTAGAQVGTTPVACSPRVLDWHTAVGQNNSGSAAGAIPIGATTLTIAASTTSPVAVYHDLITPTSPGIGPSAPQGTLPRYYCIGIGSQGGGPGTQYTQYPIGSTSQATFTFGAPVEDLRFTIVDIDRGGTNGAGAATGYQDIVQINWLPATTTMTAVAAGATPTFEGSNPYQARNPPGASTGNAAADTNDGNLDVAFNGPITEFQVVYTAGAVAGTLTTQIIGISDLRLCA